MNLKTETMGAKSFTSENKGLVGNRDLQYENYLASYKYFNSTEF